MVWCFFPDKPPAEVKAKGATGTKNQLFLDKQNNPYGFAVGLKDVACKEPGCCCIATLGTPCGCTALPTASKRTLPTASEHRLLASPGQHDGLALLLAALEQPTRGARLDERHQPLPPRPLPDLVHRRSDDGVQQLAIRRDAELARRKRRRDGAGKRAVRAEEAQLA